MAEEPHESLLHLLAPSWVREAGRGDAIPAWDRGARHATEVGQYDEANSEKLRLEQKQRAARKAADRGDPIKPLWFDVRPEVSKIPALSLHHVDY